MNEDIARSCNDGNCYNHDGIVRLQGENDALRAYAELIAGLLMSAVIYVPSSEGLLRSDIRAALAKTNEGRKSGDSGGSQAPDGGDDPRALRDGATQTGSSAVKQTAAPPHSEFETCTKQAPVEPTPEMLEAVKPWPKHWTDDYLGDNKERAVIAHQIDQAVARQTYQTMLAAAPSELRHQSCTKSERTPGICTCGMGPISGCWKCDDDSQSVACTKEQR